MYVHSSRQFQRLVADSSPKEAHILQAIEPRISQEVFTVPHNSPNKLNLLASWNMVAMVGKYPS